MVCALFLSSCGKSTDSSSTDYDTTAPTVSSTNPASDVTGVAVDSKIFVTFSEAMDVSTINTTNFTLSGSSGAVSGTVTYSGTVATFIPSTSLSPFSTYTAKITHDVKDLAGNNMVSDYSWNFTTGASTTDAANISMTATPSTITTTQTSSIQALITTAPGANVADGTTVSFTISSSIYGSITASATTSSGIATATFTAASVPGTVTITASVAGGLSNTATIVIAAPATGSIVYSGTTASALGIKGTGQTETATLTFAVKDINGNPVIDGTSVSFTMGGPGGGRLPDNGGEYIGDLDTTPTTASVSTSGGNALINLHSGSVAGPVVVSASVTSSNNQTISASSAVISIGGGLPSASHFNLATSRFNLPGLVVSNSQATIRAYIADRFGNYNVLTGTSVSFYTEAGAIDRSDITDETGKTDVIFRTQSPDPANVSPSTDETDLIDSLYTTYGLSIPYTTSYRDGWTKVMSTVQGEEAFLDENGNGLFDSSYSTTACPTGYTCQCSTGSVSGPASCGSGSRSEGFIDIGEPFIDKNDDSSRDNGQVSGSPFEEWIDVNGNGVYNDPNGVWDGPGCTGTNCLSSKVIWTSITLAFTGNAEYCEIFPTTFAITNGGSPQSFSFMVSDIYTNRLVSGTTIKVEASKGTMSPTSPYTYTVPDGVPYGPTEISFTLSDPDTDLTFDSSTIIVTVSSTDVITCPPVSISGTVQ
ncbi:MAG: hypothetical protein A2Y48_04115 [Nitrospirae bacterium RIFCSPLOW2_12_42_9]|nr:MAG: hypothetical protein A2Y48_04115 [Nitrospirae bacterium RIFCSPLOW2_12_42_9]